MLSDPRADDQHPRRGPDSWSPSWPSWQYSGWGLQKQPKQAPQHRPSLEVPVSKPGSGFGPGSLPVPTVRVLRALYPEEVSPNIAVTVTFIYEQNTHLICTHMHIITDHEITKLHKNAV